ncbi:MAG: DUF302 domain-containing protein [Gemmatimonadota bacterium]
MEATPFSMRVLMPVPVDEAEGRVRDALASEGFGVLARIDIDTALREKIGAEIGDYRILGACNPPLAERALRAEPGIGVLLPCNVVLRRAPGEDGTIVEAMDPVAVMRTAGDETLIELAHDVRSRMEKVLERVAPGHS